VCSTATVREQARRVKLNGARHQPTNGVSNPPSFSIIPQYGISFFLSSLSLSVVIAAASVRPEFLVY